MSKIVHVTSTAPSNIPQIVSLCNLIDFSTFAAAIVQIERPDNLSVYTKFPAIDFSALVRCALEFTKFLSVGCGFIEP